MTTSSSSVVIPEYALDWPGGYVVDKRGVFLKPLPLTETEIAER